VCAAHLMGMTTSRAALSGLDPLLSVHELAEYLGVPVRTIYDWRQTGHGPRGIRVGRHLKFAVSDVAAWIAAQREATPDGRDHARG
jgi:excisionase family DNA binding protein